MSEFVLGLSEFAFTEGGEPIVRVVLEGLLTQKEYNELLKAQKKWKIQIQQQN